MDGKPYNHHIHRVVVTCRCAHSSPMFDVGAFDPLICIGHQIALPMHRHSVSLRLMKANVAHPTDETHTVD